MASHGKSPQQEDQYREAKVYHAIKFEELQIESVLPMEKTVVEHISHSSGLAKPSEESQNVPESCKLDDENDKIHQNETNEKACRRKIPKNLQSNECEHKYAHSQSLYSHRHVKLKKTVAEKLQCDKCERQFLFKRSLTRHKKIYHGEIRSPCGECGRLHRETTIENICPQKIPKHVECDECGQKYSYSSSLYRHQREEHGQCSHRQVKLKKTAAGKLQCDKCERQFLFKRSLTRHKKNFHGEIRSPCGKCGRLHRDTTNENICPQKIPKHVECDECGQKYSYPSSLYRHQREEHGQVKLLKTAAEKLQCDQCERQFTLKQSLTRHKKNFHGKIRSRPCGHCGKIVALSSMHEHEMKCLHNTKFVSCDECGKKFMKECNLLRHKQVCSELRNQHCNGCEQLFFTRNTPGQHQHKVENLIKHKQNCGDKPNQCDKCGQRFILKRSLKKHKQIAHGKLATKVCDKCGKVLSVFSMRGHKRTCRGRIKILSCDECDKKFTIFGSLRQHKRIHHKTKLLPEQETSDKHGELQLAGDAPDPSKVDELFQVDAMSSARDIRNSNSQLIHNHLNHNFKIDKMPTSKPSPSKHCDICDQIFVNPRSIVRHKRIFHGQLFSKMCKHCGEKIRLNKFQSHVRLCTALVEETSTIIYNSNMATSITSLKYKCDECGKKYAHSQSLNKHKSLYHSSRMCETCGKEFSLTSISGHVCTCKDQRMSASSDECGEDSSKMLKHKQTKYRKGEVSESTAELLPSSDSPHEVQRSDTIKTRELLVDSSVENDDFDDWNAQPALTEAIQEKTHELQLTGKTSGTLRPEELPRMDSMPAMQNTLNFNTALVPFAKGNGISHIDIKTETNPGLVESDQKDSNTHIAIPEKTNPTLLEFDERHSNLYCVIKTENTEDDYTFLETNDSHRLLCERQIPSQPCDDCGKEFTKTSSLLSHKRICREVAQKLTSNLQAAVAQVDVIKTEELHIESLLPAIEEDIFDLEAPSEFKGTHQPSTSSGIATKIFRDDYAIPELASRSSTVEQASPAAFKINCDECGQSFTRTYNLRRHIRLIHRGSTQTCKQCGMEFTLYLMRKHRKVCSGSTFVSVSCEECGKKFPQTSILLKHKQLCHRTAQEFNNNLKVAEKRVDEIKTEELHIESSFPVVEENVSSINAISTSSDADQRTTSYAIATELSTDDRTLPDVITSDVERPSPAVSKINCDECGQSFTRRYNLRRHIRVIHKGTTQICEQCGMEFTLYLMRKHRKVCSGPTFVSVSCEECGKKFPRTSILLKHKQLCHRTAQEFNNNLKVSDKRVDEIKTEKLHIESSFPAVEENVSSINATSTSSDADQQTTSYAIVTELSRDDPTLQDVITSNVERPSPAAAKINCDECGQSFTRRYNLRRHISVIHKGTTQICEQCGMEFNLYLMRKHRKVCSGPTFVSVSCEECGKKFPRTSILLKHKQLCHRTAQEFNNNLKVSDKRVDEIKTEKLHIESSFPAVEENVSSINATSTSSDADQRTTSYAIATELSRDDPTLQDVITSNVEGPSPAAAKINCDECGQSFTRRYNLRRHIRVIHKGTTQICEQCGMEFTLYLMRKHRKVCSGPTFVSVSCEECGKKFPQTSILLKHKQLCHRAAQEFNNNLKVAEKRVDEIKTEKLHIESSFPVVEENVSSINATSTSSDADQRTTSYAIATELSRDERTLQDVITSNVERPSPAAAKINCDECGQSFTRRYNLRRHISVIHKGTTQICEQCGMEFNLYLMRKHRKVCSGPTFVSVSCEECGKKFPRTSILLKHKQLCHRTAQEFNNNLKVAEKRVDEIKTEELHIESSFPVVEEIVSSINATSTSSDADQRTTSYAIATELSRDDRTLPDVITSNLERPSPAVSKAYSVHKKSTRKCEHCGYEYALRALKRHRLSCKGPVLFSVSCDECGKKFSRIASLMAHRQDNHGIAEAPNFATHIVHCDECGYYFTRMSSLKRHINVAHKVSRQTRSSHGAAREELTIDLQVAEEQVEAIKTEELHIEPLLPVVKQEASMETDQETNSSSIVTELPRDGCEPLEAVDSSNIIEQPSPAVSRAHCKECGQSFSRKYSLKRHINVAHKGSTLARSSYGTALEEVPSDLQEVEGQVHAITTEERDDFEQPIVVNNVERPNSVVSKVHCDECGQQFTLASSLRRHVNVTHRGSTRTCEQCGNDFTLNTIRIHRWVCKGPRVSAACHECGKKFSKTSSLFSHQQVCHGVEPEPDSDLQTAEEQLVTIKNEELNIESLLSPVEGDVSA